MKTIELVTTGDSHYDATCRFANDVYKGTIGASTRPPPDTFIVALDGDVVHGCIGLSSKVTSSTFLNDERYQKLRKTIPPHVQIGEQNILAVSKFCTGLPVLIAAESAYAQSIGISKIAFTGIAVSCKAVVQMGFDVTVLGETPISVFSDEEKLKYSCWLEENHPLSCVLDTGNASDICKNVLHRFSRKVRLSYELESCLTPQKAVGL